MFEYRYINPSHCEPLWPFACAASFCIPFCIPVHGQQCLTGMLLMSAQHRAVIPRNTHDPSIQDGLGIPEAARGRDGGNGERDPRRRKMEKEMEREEGAA